ncbi:cellulase family glycosylhydrolase [Mycobacterium sp. MMS18-G62]
MRRQTTRRLQRYAIAAVIAAMPLAAMCAAMAYLLNPKPKPIELDFMPVVAIEESSTTVGIADSDLYGMSDADIIKTFDEMQSLGVDTVRVLVPWGGVQPYDPNALFGLFSGYRDWSKVDFIVNQAVERNMAVLGVLNSTPYWGAQDGNGCLGCYGAAPDPQKFAAFAAEVAAHFGGDISAYEVWNEPNYIQSWSPAIDPVSYTEVLKQVYTAIKAANSDALVVAGVLGTVVNFGGVTMDARDFVETMYANGAKGFFDALSIHPYQYTTKFSEGDYTWWKPWNADSPLQQLIAIRQLMIDNGDAALRIWASEYGLPTAGPNAVTQEQQSAFIKDFLNAWSKLDYTGPSFIYTTRDRIDGTQTEDGSFGLFNYDWTAKLAAQVIKDFIAAHQTPTDPGGPATPPDLGTQLSQALQAFFDQVRTAFQGFVNSWNSFVNSIAQAIANIFNPGGAAASSVPATMQAQVAEGTTMAAKAVKEDTTTASDTSGSDAAKPDAAEATATADVAAEDVSTATTTAAAEASTISATTAKTEESTPATADAKASDTEKSTTEGTKSSTADAKSSTDGTTKSDTTVKTDAEATKTPPSAQTDTGSTTGAATSTESREPTRTEVVVRPTKAATGGTEGSATSTSNGDTTGGTTGSTATSGSGESDSRGAS